MANLFAQFTKLIPTEPTLIGTITAHNADGTSTITLPGGGIIRARGVIIAVGLKAFVKGGEVAGEAPNLTAYTLDV